MPKTQYNFLDITMVGKIPEEFILKENKYELKRYIISGCFLLYGSDATLVPYPYIRVTFINYGQPEAPVTDSGTSVTMNLPNSGN